jgi:hypothetical protein
MGHLELRRSSEMNDWRVGSARKVRQDNEAKCHLPTSLHMRLVLLRLVMVTLGAYDFSELTLSQLDDFVLDARGDLSILALQLSQFQEFT